MQETVKELPHIPDDFTRPIPWQTMLYLTYALVLYLTPGYLAYQIAISELFFPIKLIAIPILTFIAAYGLFMLGVTGHEGFHYTLHSNRLVSAGLGIFFSSAVPCHSALGFALNHWDHHRYTNTQKDPDFSLLTRYRNMLTRLVYARPEVSRKYFRLNIACLFNSSSIKPHTLGIAKPLLQRLGFLNLVTITAWLTAYSFVIWFYPIQGLFVIVLP